jgi:peptidoglycan hydrolase-like protein with peptidoglycan-binding domain
MRQTRARRWTGIGALLLVLAVVGAACGGGDDSSVSTGGTTTTTANNDGGSDGADGNDVFELQRELLALGCDPGPLDGKLGADTVAAIKRFQAAADLVPDGVVGPDTRAILTTANETEQPKCPVPPPTPPTAAPTAPPTAAPTSPTTGGGGGTPVCTDAAIRPAVIASLGPGEQLFKLNKFNCANIWAVATPDVGADPQNDYEITVLLRWNGSAWQVVDRGVYCDNGAVPQSIYQAACESN